MENLNWMEVKETEDELNDGTSFYVLATKEQYKELDFYLKQANNMGIITKRKNAQSSIIKLIIENTYLYLNNVETGFNADLEALINKKYYKDIDPLFIKDIKKNKKEYDFIKELVRMQLLRLFPSSADDDEELIKYQFRLAEDDHNLMRILYGSPNKSLSEFLSRYLNYFLSVSADIKRRILRYPADLKIERAIREHRCIVINGMKLKPIKMIKSIYVNPGILAFDCSDNRFREFRFRTFTEIDETDEYFELNGLEKEFVNAYNNLNVVEATFKVIKEDKHITRILNREGMGIISVEYNDILYKIKFKYFRGTVYQLERAKREGIIDYLCYSDNYNTYAKLLKEVSSRE